MSDKAFSRRAFLTGLAAVGAVGWVYDSNALSARVIRGTLDDVQRSVTKLPAANLSDWSSNSVDILWVGHATVLLNFNGIHILTDPVLFNRVGAQVGIATVGRKRLVGPALDPNNLPKIDLVLLSHAHMDHLDLPSLSLLEADVPIITAPKTTDLLQELAFTNVNELRWGEKSCIKSPAGEVSVQAVEVKHWGARWKTDSYRGYVGYLLEREGKTILFGGDTAYTGTFRELNTRRIDVAIMPIGCYGSRSGNHCTPEEAARMTNECQANYIVPIHHSTFPIGQEPVTEPLERLNKAISPDRIALQKPGEIWRMIS